MRVISGQALAEQFQLENKSTIEFHNIHPKLVIIQIGDNFASNLYVEKKRTWGESIGVDVEVLKFDEVTEAKLIEIIESLNADNTVDGIMVQLPIPKDFNKENIFLSIWPEKDVDGLNPISLGSIFQKGSIGHAPATPLAVLEILRHISIYNDNKYTSDELNKEIAEKEFREFLKGKKVLIVNRSTIVGKPLAGLLLNYDATVTIAHSKTNNIDELIKNSEIIISGTGVHGFINKENIPQNSILIDIGINDTANGIGGDIDYRGAESMINWITPVPGGVGPITVSMLLRNTINSCISSSK